MNKRKDPSSVDIQRVLLDMREYRMGLIQTPDQLRFSYMAVIEGGKHLLKGPSAQNQSGVVSKMDGEPMCSPPTPPLPSPPPPLPRTPSDSNGLPLTFLKPNEVSSKDDRMAGEPLETANVRKRHREERIASTSLRVQQMKQRLSETDKQKETWLRWRPLLLNIGAGAGVVVAVAFLVSWMYGE